MKTIAIFLFCLLCSQQSLTAQKAINCPACDHYNGMCKDKDGLWVEDKDHSLYRSYENKKYYVIDSSGLWIYKCRFSRLVFVGKRYTNRSMTYYYFSVAPCSELFDLTKAELRKALKNQPAFIEQLKKVRERNLPSFEKGSNMTVANKIYQESLGR